MLGSTGYFHVGELEAEQVISQREREGWRVFRLPAESSSKDDFFDAVRQTLPLDPPLQSNRSWDALADSLWGGLDGLPNDRVVILWPGASAMERAVPDEFAIAMAVLKELADSPGSSELTTGVPKKLLVLRVS